MKIKMINMIFKIDIKNIEMNNQKNIIAIKTKKKIKTIVIDQDHQAIIQIKNMIVRKRDMKYKTIRKKGIQALVVKILLRNLRIKRKKIKIKILSSI